MRDLSRRDIDRLLTESQKIKTKPRKYNKSLEGKTLLMLFEKPSTRTRVSFEAGVTRMGGHAIYFSSESSQISRGETVADTARTLSRYCDAIMARVFSHKTVVDLAEYATVPVINGLSDLEHPCQIMADLFTMKENGKLDGRIVYVGDGNNVCNSLALAAEVMGLDFTVSCPSGYDPKLGNPTIERNPIKAAKDADVLYTDVWVSMGDEKQKEAREKTFRQYQLNRRLLSNAKKDCIIMHCLPAHRGVEITDDVIDSQNSVVFDQAENRMHAQNAILLHLVK